MSESSYSSYASSSDENIELEGDIINNYNIIALLGKGAYSRVWLAYNINDSKYYALKVQNPDDFDEGKDEIKILKKIPKDESYINQLVEYFIDTRIIDEKPVNFICSVYNLCCGNLDGLSRKGKYKKGYPEELVKKMFKQILLSLETVHYKLDGFHGDIKPDNILLCGLNYRDAKYIQMYDKANFTNIYNKTKKEYCTEKKITKIKSELKTKIRKKIHQAIIGMMEDNKEDQYTCDDKYFQNPIVKLTDFGFYCPNSEKYNESFGTRYYMAPEIVLMGECSSKVDIWSLGCMLYELLTGEILFDPHSSKRGSTDFHHLEMMINLCGEFNKYYSKEALKQMKHYKNFFKNDKLVNISYNDNFKQSNIDKISNKLKDHNINNPLICDLIESCLRISSRSRPSVKEILNHPWLT
jgi:serine/threonine-protein kinase SRPK3